MKRKLISFLLALMTCFGFASCDFISSLFGSETETSASLSAEEELAAVEETGEDMVAIRVLKAEENQKLVDIMKYLREKEALSFTTDASGMVNAINGKANPADWSYCWMLYTSDGELSNTEWGTYTYKGETLGSAMFGAEALPVLEGEVYVWVYTKF
ncbi:MAG: hypothetical protein IJ284_01900 [Clostridia bacterium]|nr:hypothetical protein [Clostridia bacterium]